MDNVSFDIEPGDRICLVGRNGEGKSTLLKVLTGEMDANSGDIVKKSGLKVSRMVQEIPAHMEGTVRDVVMGGVTAGGTGHDADENVHNAHAEAILGKTGIAADAAFDSLSGGQKRRVLFARAVASDPDLLLLDEPTNHLDIPAIQWLEGIVTRLECAVLFVSHDRAFVRRVATRRTNARSWLTNSTAHSRRVTIPSSHWMAGMSRWFVGSSSKSRSGSLATARAKSTRLFCPPLSESNAASAAIPVFPRIASAWALCTFSSASCPVPPAVTPPITTSRTVPSM